MTESILVWFDEFKKIYLEHKHDYATIVMKFLLYADKEEDDIKKRLNR